MDTVQEFLKANPHYGYLFAAIGFGVYLLGLILRWKWTIEPGGGYFNITYFIKLFGELRVRIFLGIVMVIAMTGSMGAFLYYQIN